MQPPHSFSSPVFHTGERQLQTQLGVGDRLNALGARAIRPFMPDQHRLFFEQLRLVHLSAVDASGHPWAITRTGARGFMLSPEPSTLHITSRPHSGEPANLDLSAGAKISVLGLEMETRRRNRMNGTIRSNEGDTLTISVDQSYGNCPKYIQPRTALPDQTKVSTFSAGLSLSARDQALISAADLFMLASRAPTLGDDPRDGIDINHRGGRPGFVEVLDADTLQWPDYRGNNFYNSFGNILLDNRVGLQFFDFGSGTTLNINGTAALFDTEADMPPHMGRSVRITIESVTRADGALPLRYAATE